MFLKVCLLSVNCPLWVKKHSKLFNPPLYDVVEPKDPKMTETIYFKLIALIMLCVFFSIGFCLL